MPHKTPEERQVRDRKVFLLHSLFIDHAILRGVESIRRVVMGNVKTIQEKEGMMTVVYSEEIGDLNITVMKDTTNGSYKVDTKIDGSRTTGIVDATNLLQRNLVKGITADENTAANVKKIFFNSHLL